MHHHPMVFWLFGLSGAGKSTLAAALRDSLSRPDVSPPLMLDGDHLRHGFCQGLGFSDADRNENLRRAAHVARLGIDSGLNVIASFITPREAQRAMVRQIIGPEFVVFVWVSASLAVCQRRDVKGLYAGAAAGRVAQMTGVASAFEVPAQADLTLSTDAVEAAVSAAELAQFARGRLRSG